MTAKCMFQLLSLLVFGGILNAPSVSSQTTVGRTAPAFLNCPNDISRIVELGEPDTNVSWTEPTCNDTSGGVFINSSHTPPTIFSVGMTVVSYTCADVSGNSATCFFKVNIITEDTTPPLFLNCPNDTSVTRELGEPFDVSLDAPSCYDRSGSVFINHTHTVLSDSEIVFSYNCIDESGNYAACFFKIYVTFVDTTPPRFTYCPDDTSKTVELGEAGSAISEIPWKRITVKDNSHKIFTNHSHGPKSFFGLGTTVVSLTAEDESGNFATCTFQVNVTTVDTTPPQFLNCPNDISATVELGDEPGSKLAWITPACNDLSGRVCVSSSHTPPSFFPLGMTNVSYTCTDVSGNSANCTFQVHVATAFCEMEILNNTLAGRLTFPNISAGQTATSKELCPVYSSTAGEPRASRLCSRNFRTISSQWEEPVINNCFHGETDDSGLNDLMVYLDSHPVTDENVTEVSRDLADATEMKNLTSSDLDIVAELLEVVIGVESSSPEVTNNVIDTVDNVMDLDENDYVNSINKAEAPSRILRSLENQLSNLHKGENAVNFKAVRAFVGVVARNFDMEDFLNSLTFVNFCSHNERRIQENCHQSDPKDRTEQYQLLSSFTAPVTYSSFMSKGNLARVVDEEVESLVISATIEGKRIDGLAEPVVSKFYPKPEAKEESRRCVFWDFNLADGFGDWSEEGCKLVTGPGDGDESLIECHCTHLTSYAILVDKQGDIERPVLDTLSIIGCALSIPALLITIITYLAVKKLREKRPQLILINLCAALLGLNLCFVIGIDRSDLPVGCVIFGAFIHYFCLASVAWMCVEATNMYLFFVRVFDANIRGFMRKVFVAAWGLPLVVVVVCVVLGPDYYTSKYCFPVAETMSFYLGVLLLVGLMLCYNFVMYILIIRKLTCGRKRMGQERNRRQEIRRRTQNAIAISVLVGLSWMFGFLSFGEARLFFNLMFIIFNSLQGLFVFILFGLMQKEFRTIWWSCLRCGGGKDNNYPNSKSAGVFPQDFRPTSKDYPAMARRDEKTNTCSPISIEMIGKRRSATMNDNEDRVDQ